ncbi:ATP6V0B [Cordylochernes scorpioides]|uniref:ATP6V0B n=1 Tax=Cordylochernes scorpioides TaxID=51811 RepID=A0ABY6K1X6_9ARAC|nr:ATP6V0B [Cordylochernes scorpioides]
MLAYHIGHVEGFYQMARFINFNRYMLFNAVHSVIYRLQAERLLSVKSAIQKALIDVNANVRLIDEDFDIMTQVISVLKPFRAAVAAICRRDATLLTAEATVKFILEELQAQSHSLSKDLQKLFKREF